MLKSKGFTREQTGSHSGTFWTGIGNVKWSSADNSRCGSSAQSWEWAWDQLPQENGLPTAARSQAVTVPWSTVSYPASFPHLVL